MLSDFEAIDLDDLGNAWENGNMNIMHLGETRSVTLVHINDPAFKHCRMQPRTNFADPDQKLNKGVIVQGNHVRYYIKKRDSGRRTWIRFLRK